MLQIKQSRICWIIIVTFFSNLLFGNGLLLPVNTLAYHDPNTGDQGHNPGYPNPVEPSHVPDDICQGKEQVGSEVYLHAGDFSSSYQDLFIPGRGPNLSIKRAFDSQEMYDGPFGIGWKFNYDVRLIITSDAEKEIAILRKDDGVRLKFSRNEDGSYSDTEGRDDYLAKNADGTFTWKPSGCAGCGSAATGYQFDGSGVLLKQGDENGNEMVFSYDATGKLIQVTDASGRSITIAYGSNHKISSITDPANRIFSYAYDGLNDLISYTDPAGNTTSYSYDAKHNLTGVTDSEDNTIHTMVFDDHNRLTSYTRYGENWTVSYDERFGVYKTYVKGPNDQTWTYQYNETGQLLYKWDPLGNLTTNTWDENLNLTSIKDAKGFTTTYGYNESGEKISETDAVGNITFYTYDAVENKLSAITDPSGVVTKYEYDAKGNLAKYIRDYGGALQNQILYTHDSNGFLTSTTDPMGNKTSYTYDTYGNQTQITDALGNKTTFTHDILGNMLTWTDPSGNTTTFSYDLLNRINAITNAADSITTLAYDIHGKITRITDAAGNSMAMSYNAHGKPVQVTDPLGNSVNFAYDDMGNRDSIIDANGNTTSYVYDAIGQLTEETNTTGHAIHFTYDRNGNQTSITDANAHKTSFTYDALNRLTKTTYPDGKFASFSYNGNSNLASRTDRNGNTITFTYDALQRVTTKTYPDASTVDYAYNLNGRVVSAESPDVSYTATHDTLNRLTKMTNATLGKSVSYAYLANGLKSTMTNPEGGVNTYAYNTLGRVTEITNSLGEKTEYTYDSLSRIIQKTFANGSYSTYTYDKKSRLTDLANTSSSNSVFDSYTYTYDKADNKTTMTDTSGAHAYTYDKIYQLLNATHPTTSSESYTYDGVYNRLTSADHDDWAYDSNNRLLSYANMSFTYNANGNMTHETDTSLAETTAFQYDYENRLKRIDYHDGTYVEYHYGPFGNRVKKDINGTVVWFVYDLSKTLPDVIAEYDIAGVLTAGYTHGPGTDETISLRRGGNSFFYMADGLGSITALVDEDETLVNSYAYDAFGNELAETESISNPYGYTGRRLDEESGLMYYRSRYYNPAIGRFISADSIGFAGGINAYSYVLNNPINAIDPTGEKDCAMKEFVVYLAWGGVVTGITALALAIGAASAAIPTGVLTLPMLIAVMATAAGLTLAVGATLAASYEYQSCLKSLKNPCPDIKKKLCKLDKEIRLLKKTRKIAEAARNADAVKLRKLIRGWNEEKSFPGSVGIGSYSSPSPDPPGTPNPGEAGDYYDGSSSR